MGHLKLMAVKIFNHRGNAKFSYFRFKILFYLLTWKHVSRLMSSSKEAKRHFTMLYSWSLLWDLCSKRTKLFQLRKMLNWRLKFHLFQDWNFARFSRLQTRCTGTRLGVKEITVRFVITFWRVFKVLDNYTCFDKRTCNILAEAEVLKNWGF